MANQSTSERSQQQGNSAVPTRPQNDLAFVDQFVAYFRKSAHEDPERVALMCLGVGFVLGWKLKPW